jgi:hypothetical protein
MRCRSLTLAILLVACGAGGACGTTSDGGAGPAAQVPPRTGDPASADAGEPGTGGGTSEGGSALDAGPVTLDGGRDWAAHPAIVDVPAPTKIYAVSDVHGGYDRLATLLLGNQVLSRAPTTAKDAHWGAAGATLVVTGDLIDKGPSGLEVIDFLMALQADAQAGGGRVVVTLGNHEAEFLVDPTNAKASGPGGIDAELSADGIAPATLASAADPRGAWLRVLPFGARVGGWFFSHAGDTGGRAVDVLGATLEAAVKAHADYNDPAIVGTSSILESRAWYTAAVVAQNAAALGVKHIVFGHDPNALGARGAIAVAFGNALVRIDCGMSPGVDDSKGKLLRVMQQGANDVVDELDPAGASRALFQSPR